MFISKEPSLPQRRCAKILRPVDARWLAIGPLADVPTVIRIHRYRRRTVECFPEDCPLCENLATAEERLFLPVLYGSPAQRAVLELPLSHRTYLLALATTYRTLRALTLELRRRNGLPNGPIEWRVFPRSKDDLPKREESAWLDELSATWEENTIFAHAAVAAEKSVRDVRPGCTIDSGSDH